MFIQGAGARASEGKMAHADYHERALARAAVQRAFVGKKHGGIGKPAFPVFALAIVAAAGILLVSSSKIHLEISRTDGEIPHARIAESVGELWKRGARGGILLALWVFVWSLLFVIPGIVKFVSYSQMFFIMAENKNVGAARAMRMSKAMTDGHKADIALMAMSFLGWIFLSMLTSGIGFLWLCPYMATSFANAYSAMKIEAIRSGRLLPADFN